MELTINENLMRVVILCIDGLYSHIYDEVYCTKDIYYEILVEYGNSSKYKVVLV